jgi:SAM-dependent methyltransferase
VVAKGRGLTAGDMSRDFDENAKPVSCKCPPRYEEALRCLFCSDSHAVPVLNLKWSHMCQDRFGGAGGRDAVGVLNVCRCQNCGLEYQNPRPTQELLLSVAKSSYNLRYSEGERGELFDDDLGRIRRWVPSGALLLDVGCNTGAFLKLAGEYYEVAGCDPIGRALEVGRRDFGLGRLYEGTLEQVPMSPVDVIVSLDTFEHMHDPVFFLSEVHRRLKPGGFFYVRTIRKDGPNARLAGKYWYGYSIWHLFYPTIEQVKELCRRSGLEPVQTVVTRGGWFHFRTSAAFHLKRAVAGALPFLQRSRRFIDRIRNGERVFSFYRDEFALVCRRREGHGG